MLAVDSDETFGLLEQILPRLRRTDPEARPRSGNLVVLSLSEVEGGNLTVPEALDRIDAALRDNNPALAEDGVPLVTPVHIMHIAKICPADEPEVPSGYPAQPWPGPSPAGEGGHDVKIGVSDTGLLQPLDPAQYPWLAGVDGDPEDPFSGSPPRIPPYAGHGTFVAGCVRAMAPKADVWVRRTFQKVGAEYESDLVKQVSQVLRTGVDIISLDFGSNTRSDIASLGFDVGGSGTTRRRAVAAAGNDATTREVLASSFGGRSVSASSAPTGGPGPVQHLRPLVDVYAPGEALVNAFATGGVHCEERPKRPAKQDFAGMATWSGTSFSAPLVAGLIAAEMSRTGDPASAAKDAVLATAQDIPGVGPALFPPDGA